MYVHGDRRIRRRCGVRGKKTTQSYQAIYVIGALIGSAVFLAACQTTPRLPPSAHLDASEHLLASSNFQSQEVKKTRLIVTGMPEGPNKVSDSSGSTLDDFFARQDRETAYGQIYAPSVFRSRTLYRRYLEHVLEQTRGPVDLLVYSMGAFSLMDLPKQYWENIRSLTFSSPVVGRETFSPGSNLANKITAALARILLPSADLYMGSIDGLLEYLITNGATVRVNLGSRDTFLDNAAIAKQFDTYNTERTRIIIETTDRPHGMTAGQVNDLFEAADSERY